MTIAYWKGKKLSEETKKKMSLSHKGKNTWSKGILIPEERKKRISQSLKGVKKKPFSEEHRKNIGLSLRGKNNGSKSHLWKGGITPVNEVIRHSREYKLWRTAVFERDNYTCVWCGSKSGKDKKVELNADHIKPFSQYPELRFAIDNGRTLCRPCHLTTDTWGEKCKKYAEKH